MSADLFRTHSKAGPPALRLAEGLGWALDRVAMLAAIGSLVVIFLSLMAEVIVRYLTDASLGWPNEVPNLLFPWLIMGGIVMGALRGAHIAAEAIRSALGKTPLRILLMAIHGLVAVSFCYLAYLSIDVIEITKAQVFPISGLGQAWAYSALLFGFGGITLASVINLIRTGFSDDPLNLFDTDVEHTT